MYMQVYIIINVYAGQSVYHPTVRLGEVKQPHQWQSFTAKPFSQNSKAFSGSLNKPTKQHKIDRSRQRLFNRANISVRDFEITDLTLSQQEVELTKTGSQNLTTVLGNEELWD